MTTRDLRANSDAPHPARPAGDRPMSLSRLVAAGLQYYWTRHLTVALAVATATAVLTGALVIGDSMRASLRHLVLDRYGRIDQVLLTDHFFEIALADRLRKAAAFRDPFVAVCPTLLLPGSVEAPRDARTDASADASERSRSATVIGVGPWFWDLGSKARPERQPHGAEIVLNEPLANRLQLAVGDEVIVRFARPASIPADSPLGQKTDTVQSRRMAIVAIVPAEGLGRFDLSNSQQLPRNAYVPLDTMQAMLQRPGQANTLLVATASADQVASEEESRALQSTLKPALADFGLHWRQVRIDRDGEPVRDFFQLVSERVLLPTEALDAVVSTFADRHPQVILTYLANWITVGRSRIPYSTVTGVDSTSELGPLTTDIDGNTIGPLADDEIVLNQWAAKDLDRQGTHLEIGDQVSIRYFEPESTHGRVVEREAVFRLKAIAPLARPGELPSGANDPDLTPQVAGVTDAESIADWEPPFPFDPSRVRTTPPHDEDEAYWRDYRATPKAFVSFAAAHRLWASRFGAATAVRIAGGGDVTVASLERDLLEKIDPTRLGYTFQPVKRRGLEASRGTTPFAGLFLGFSMFLIAAAVMLVALFFQLGVERRVAEVGLMRAVGMANARIARVVGGEGSVVAMLGSGVGLLGGVGFAAAMLALLQSPHGWLRAIGVPFLRLEWTSSSLLIGYFLGVVVGLLVIYLSLRRLRGRPVRQLLAGRLESSLPARRVAGSWPERGAWGLLIVAVGLGLAATRLGGEAQAGAFFGAGALTLSATCLQLGCRLRRESTDSIPGGGRWPLLWLAWQNSARHAGRSMLSIGLVASAVYVIVSISAFRLDPDDAGAGGFDWIATTVEPIYFDLASDSGREEFGFSGEVAQRLDATTCVMLRVNRGDDASCLNLYQPRQPRVLGVPPSLIERDGFVWVATAATTVDQRANPWRLLDQPIDGALPVVLDMNTALYSLHLWKGVGERFAIEDGQGKPVTFQVVGLLKNSIFQGAVLVSEANFLRLYPRVSGYRMVLIDVVEEKAAVREPAGTSIGPEEQQGRVGDLAPHRTTSDVIGLLEQGLGDLGFEAVPTRERLEAFLDVQN
ncbi:MAG: FtsX-like permease family protein, partial [Pirellulales bacterium]